MLKKDKPNKTLLALKAFSEMENISGEPFYEVIEAFEESAKTCINLFYSWDMIIDTVLYEYLEKYRGSQSEFYKEVQTRFMEEE